MAIRASRNTILLKGYLHQRHEEAVAASTISPGMLLELTTTNTIQGHTTAVGRAERLVAKEDSLQGNTVDSTYAAGDIVLYHILQSGNVFLGLFVIGVAYAIGDLITSNGNGLFKKSAAPATDFILGRIMEAKDLTAAAVPDLVVCRSN